MDIYLNNRLADKYKSNSQKIRVLTESWVESEIFCPACGSFVVGYENNKPVADFYCEKCREDYELKSKKNSLGSKVVDGAYSKMIERLSSDSNPNFFFLNYDLARMEILNFFVVPKHFFTSEIIEKRKPLSSNAKRFGWIGCNIVIKDIPQTGKISYIKNGKIEPKNLVLESWNKTLFLREDVKTESKGWLLDVMKCIDKIGGEEFRLEDVYRFEKDLEVKYPNNKHIKDKIRQQLQFLRDKDYLKFIGRGKYRLI